MREMHHDMWEGGILFPDPRSSKVHYGLNQPEFLDSKSDEFLREGLAQFAFGMIHIFKLTNPNESGFLVAEIQDASGGYYEGAIHSSRIEWKK